jgi:hypothetical protein
MSHFPTLSCTREKHDSFRRLKFVIFSYVPQFWCELTCFVQERLAQCELDLEALPLLKAQVKRQPLNLLKEIIQITRKCYLSSCTTFGWI